MPKWDITHVLDDVLVNPYPMVIIQTIHGSSASFYLTATQLKISLNMAQFLLFVFDHLLIAQRPLHRPYSADMIGTVYKFVDDKELIKTQRGFYELYTAYREDSNYFPESNKSYFSF